jgi:CubicO group peptidase (beta-lactamase class C family)
MYSLASISKPITATGMMTLVQAGKIDLDKPMNDYLGDAKLKARVGDAKDATVRRVANHSSGLPLHYQFFFSNEPYQKPSYDETILRYGNLVTIPGEHYQYSNLGFGIIGYVLSRLSGDGYPDFMRDAVFIKLGMTHTSVGIGPGLEKFQAIRYDEKGAPIPFYDFDHPAASAVYSSAHDLVRFGMFHLKDHLPDQSPILSDASIDAMHQPTNKTSDHGGYGIGWASDDRPDGYHVISHSGGMPGVSTELMLVPSEDIAVVVLLNGEGRVSQIANEIFKVLLPKWQASAQKPEPPAPPFHPDAELLGTWKGNLHTYQKDLPVTITVLPSGDVHIRLADQLESLLNKAQFKDGWLSGEARGDVTTEDAERHRADTLLFNLKLRGNLLNGAVSATEDGPNPVALTQFLEVEKQQ